MRYWVTSDQHYGHGAVIKYCNRPFKSPDQMNETMVRKFNERVRTEDTTFIIGDFCFKHPKNMDEIAGGRPLKAQEWLDKLNGQKIIIKGNHDNNNSTKTCIDCIHITYAGQRINMVHKPDHSNPTIPINLVGHVHDKWRVRRFSEHYRVVEMIMESKASLKSDRKDLVEFMNRNYENRNSDSILLNIGVDQNNFYPISLDEALGQIVKFKRGLLK